MLEVDLVRHLILNSFPLRIDFILSDPNYDVLSFTTFDKEFSDHFPVKAVLDLH